MKQNGKKSKIVLTVLSSLTAFVVLLFLMFNSGIDILMTVSGWIVIPVQNACIAVADAVSGFFAGFGDNVAMLVSAAGCTQQRIFDNRDQLVLLRFT